MNCCLFQLYLFFLQQAVKSMNSTSFPFFSNLYLSIHELKPCKLSTYRFRQVSPLEVQKSSWETKGSRDSGITFPLLLQAPVRGDKRQIEFFPQVALRETVIIKLSSKSLSFLHKTTVLSWDWNWVLVTSLYPWNDVMMLYPV